MAQLLLAASLPTRRLAHTLRAPHLGQKAVVAVGATVPLRVPHAASQQRGIFWRRKKDDEADPAAQDSGALASSKGSDSGAKSSGSRAAVEQEGNSAGRASEKGQADAADIASEDSGSGAIVLVGGDSGGLRKDIGGSFEARLAALPLARRPLFPGQQQILHVTHPAVTKEIMRLLEKGTPPFIAAFLHKDSGLHKDSHDSDDPPRQLEDFGDSDPLEVLHHVGTRARIVQAMPFSPQSKFGAEGLQMLIHGHDLVKLDKLLDLGPPAHVKVTKIRHATEDDGDTLKAYINESMHTIREIMKINPQFREHASMIHSGLERLERGDPHAIAHFAASLTTASGPELMEVLEAELPSDKLRLALVLLKKELDLSQLQQKISNQIEEKVSSHQREFMLREQLKMIKKELGEDKSDGTDKLVDKFRQRLEGKDVPKDAREAIDAELEKFMTLAKESQEYQTTRNYLDWLTMLPWCTHSVDTLSLRKARQILDRDHYGLNEVKERIQELIAVGSLRGSVQGKILCFVGPPGVGKTSIGRSIAEALGREFYRFSVGGLYDVAEIKGHRRTYVGAMPGKIIQALKKVQTSNPLVLIDEVDKIGQGRQGDPASALLELLDPSQNESFLDHYLDVPVDCSRILFVCTANVTDTIPGPLLDRMEVIRLSGYDLQEKVKIAQDYLVPNSMREVGLWPPVDGKPGPAKDSESMEPAAEAGIARVEVETPTSVQEDQSKPALSLPKASIETSAVEALIRWYCREAGVRNLQKHIEKICRKLATKVVEHREGKDKEDENAKPADIAKPESGKTGQDGELVELHVTEAGLSDYVGKPLFTSDRLYEGQLPAGTVTGLAWTALGGSVLYIEATALPRPGAGGAGGAAKAGQPSLSVTGQLGNVMKESSQIALLVARRQVAVRLPADHAGFFEEHDLHMHCPEGATPKDGPSAGVTMTTALLSLALGRPARSDLAMTGEVSLNGKVLAIGGVKEKTIAARRAGCRALVFPQANQRDFEELPEYLRQGLEVHFAATYDDVFAAAFPEVSEAAPAP